MKPMPSLAGTERARFQEHDWYCQIFTRANQRVLDLMAKARKDRRFWQKMAEAEKELIEQFSNHRPCNGPH
jgi:hypothetical protein